VSFLFYCDKINSPFLGLRLRELCARRYIRLDGLFFSATTCQFIIAISCMMNPSALVRSCSTLVPMAAQPTDEWMDLVYDGHCWLSDPSSPVGCQPFEDKTHPSIAQSIHRIS
jgi:hypothetical protein